MATFSDLGAIARDPNFQQRVSYALTAAAVAVCAEVETTPRHPARVAFAIRVFGGDYNVFTTCLMVLTNATVASEAVLAAPGFSISDADIQSAVNSLWNNFSSK